MNKNNIINRNIENLSVRADDETGKQYIEGYAIVFNQRSKLIREWGETFYEVIEPGAPDNVLADPGLNVIATIDHDRARMLARTTSGTLELVKDERGVKYIIEVPDTTLGRDVYEMVKRGDYPESSFIFTIAEKGVRYDTSEEVPVRTVSDFGSMHDIAIVIDGAYANTVVTARAKEYDNNNRAVDLSPSQGDEGNSPEGVNPVDILQQELIIETLK